jgi:hypothetical protein
MNKRELDLRTNLATALGVAINEAQWKHLEGLESYGAMISGEGSFNDWVVDSGQMLRDFGIQVFHQDDPIPDNPELSWNPEQDASREYIDQARSYIVAQLAREQFEDLYLGCRQWAGTLTTEEILAAFDKASHQELSEAAGPASPELTRLRDLLNAVTHHPENQHLVDIERVKIEIESQAQGVLYILLPDGQGIYRVPYFRQDGVLAEFQARLAELINAFDWTEAEAAAFLLFDIVPRIRSSITIWMQKGQFPGLNRIGLVLDPTLSPDEVREIYREERRKYCKYSMRISHKHLFAAFSAFGISSTRPWPERYKEHSETCREMPEGEGMVFANAKTFRRDAEKALNKLLSPKFGN